MELGLRVIHYLNQFFGGIGAEDKAHVGPKAIEGPLGPAMAAQNALGDRGEVVATVVCGDNYFAENIEKASQEVIELMRPYEPDLVLAGPAFNAGRYGIACGGVCKAVQNQLGIPAVTGMFRENPGLDLFRADVYILETEDSARHLTEALSRMIPLGFKLVEGGRPGRPSEEGYFPRGLLVNEIAEQRGAERVVEMLLKKLLGQPFETEVPRPKYDRVDPAGAIMNLGEATIALVTDGGLVPEGNPDGIEIRTATRFGRYDISGINTLDPDRYEVSHEGYDSGLVRQDPNRLVPVDVMRELEREGVIGKLHDRFYSTTGVANIVETMRKMGEAVAEDLRAGGVSGVILTST